VPQRHSVGQQHVQEATCTQQSSLSSLTPLVDQFEPAFIGSLLSDIPSARLPSSTLKLFKSTKLRAGKVAATTLMQLLQLEQPRPTDEAASACGVDQLSAHLSPSAVASRSIVLGAALVDRSVSSQKPAPFLACLLPCQHDPSSGGISPSARTIHQARVLLPAC